MYDDAITYLGCIGVKKSMRSLNHHMRSEVAKESIRRLCKANGIIKKSDEGITTHQDDVDRMLDEEPNLIHSGEGITLLVTSTHLSVLSRETGLTLVQHEMPNVSFASNGDKETAEFVAYVAKNTEFGRACFVLECAYKTGKHVLEKIAHGFEMRAQQINNTNSLPKTLPHRFKQLTDVSLFQTSNLQDTSLDAKSQRLGNENDQGENLISITRKYLEKESWFHGSYLSREESETRLKHDGDFLVRESMLDHGHFVLSVMHDNTKLHLLFDSVGKVKTKEMEFDDISHLIRYHHENGFPIVTENRHVYLRNGVRPTHKIK